MPRRVRATITRTAAGGVVADVQIKGKGLSKGKGKGKGPADGWRVLLTALATELEADGEPQIEVRGRNVRVVVTAPQHEVEMQGELFAAHESLIVSLEETPRPEAASEAEAEEPADVEAAAPDPPPAAPGLGGA